MKILLSLVIAIFALSGCATDMQPRLSGSSEFSDKTLSSNVVDLFTLIRVEQNYGTQFITSDSTTEGRVE